MKGLYILIAVLIVGVIYFVFSGNDTVEENLPAQEEESAETEQTQPTDESDVEVEVEAEAKTETMPPEDTAGEENEDSMDEDTPSEAEETEEPAVDVVADLEVEATTEQSFTLDSFNYGYSETELRVSEGDVVTINLTNSDGFHDWVVDEFSAGTEKISAGDTTSVTFVADTAGTYEYYCSVGNHRAQGMVGTLIVE